MRYRKNYEYETDLGRDEDGRPIPPRSYVDHRQMDVTYDPNDAYSALSDIMNYGEYVEAQNDYSIGKLGSNKSSGNAYQRLRNLLKYLNRDELP